MRTGGRIVAIDKSGRWWLGDSVDDLKEYLIAYTEDGYPATEFRISECSCGSIEFFVAHDGEEGVARRTCVKCSAEHFLCDSGEFWDDASPRRYRCVGKCRSRVANVCVGFALAESRDGIRWINVGVRCTACGVLGCVADWKVDFSPSLHLLDLA